MKKYPFAFVLLLLAFNCSNEDNNSTNPLSETGLIGEWEISERGVNNVSSLETLCCETIIFSDDSNNRDVIGTYIFADASGTVTNGVFALNIESSIILYTSENDNNYTQEYSLNTDILEVWYFENGDRYWTVYTKL